MPLREDILTPIAGDNPSGQDLRYAPVYDKIKEARKEDDALNQGAWQHERKVADHGLVIKLTQEAIAKQSKDLQLAAWLTESLARRNGYTGLEEGLHLCRQLLETFWDTLYPELDDGDAEFRVAPLEYLTLKSDFWVKDLPVTGDGEQNFNFYKYKESRTVIYEDQATGKDTKAAREAALKAGKLAPEIFDKAFGATPKAFYFNNEKALDSCLAAVEQLGKVCDEKFGDVSPSFTKLKTAIEEVRHVVHLLLQKKRETDPDPVVEEAPPVEEETVTGGEAAGEPGAEGTGTTSGPVYTTVSIQASEDPADRKELIANVVAAAAYIRRREPTNPAPYLMLRGLRWGELRAALHAKDYSKLEAPPTDARRMLKKLATDQKWKDLIEAAENLMGSPCSRAWLDMQRLVVQACVAMGPEYQNIAIALRSEIRALVRDCPDILNLTLSDDTTAANAETQAWLQEIAEEPEKANAKPLPAQAVSLDGEPPSARQKFIDSFTLAVQALRSGQETKAFEIMTAEVLRQRSGRGRFERRLQLVQLCVSAGKEALMQPILDDLLAAVETHKLDDWEDREKLASSLVTILKASKKIQADAKAKQAMFERICRLDPVQALTVG